MSSKPAHTAAFTAPVAAVVIGAVAFTLGFVRLDAKSYEYDEAFNVARTHWTWNELFHLVRFTEESQAIYLFGLKLWSGFGHSESVIRFPSVVFAAVAAGLLVLIGKRLFDLRVGVIAGLVLASNAYLVQWSESARTWTLATLVAVASTLLLLHASRSGTWTAWLAYSIVVGLGVYTDFYMGLVVVAHALTIWLTPTRIRRSQVVVCTVIFLFLIADAVRFTQRGSQFQVDWIPKPTPRLVLSTLERIGGWNWVLISAAAVGAVILALASRRDWRSESAIPAVLVIGWAVVPFVLGLLVSFTLHPIFIARYLIVSTPALALLAAVAVSRVWNRNIWLGLALLGAILVVSGFRIGQWYDENSEDWRGAAGFVRNASPPEKAVSVTPTWAVEALEVYLPGSWRSPNLQAYRRYVLSLSTVGGSPSRTAAKFVDTSAYRLVEQHRYGDQLAVTVWERRGS